MSNTPYHKSKYATAPTVFWDNSELATIDKLKLTRNKEDQCWDVSYCFGSLKSGEAVRVDLPFFHLKMENIKGQIVEFARDANVFAKGLDIFKAIKTGM